MPTGVSLPDEFLSGLATDNNLVMDTLLFRAM